MPEVKLNASDAAELAKMLQFLTGWLDRDPAHLVTSLAGFTGHPAYDLDQLRGDLARFVFLLGGDEEPLFGLQRQSPPRPQNPAKPNPAQRACNDDRRERHHGLARRMLLDQGCPACRGPGARCRGHLRPLVPPDLQRVARTGRLSPGALVRARLRVRRRLSTDPAADLLAGTLSDPPRRPLPAAGVVPPTAIRRGGHRRTAGICQPAATMRNGGLPAHRLRPVPGLQPGGRPVTVPHDPRSRNCLGRVKGHPRPIARSRIKWSQADGCRHARQSSPNLAHDTTADSEIKTLAGTRSDQRRLSAGQAAGHPAHGGTADGRSQPRREPAAHYGLPFPGPAPLPAARPRRARSLRRSQAGPDRSFPPPSGKPGRSRSRPRIVRRLVTVTAYPASSPGGTADSG
jgi:hypothetical protein